jgi:hypothetical protein
VPKFTPNQEDYTLGDVIDAQRKRTPIDQQINIQSSEPIRCSAPTCRKDIGNLDSYAIIGTPHGSVIWHLHCLGIHRVGNFNDPAYLSHIRSRLGQVVGL